MKDVDIPNPNVELEKERKINKSIAIQPNPISHNIKRSIIVKINPKIKNGVVAYLGNIEYKIVECIDFFYCNPNLEINKKKTISSALATAITCAILIDNKNNSYICSLNQEIYYAYVRTLDVESSKYGGLTYLVTKGKKYVSNLMIKYIVTRDGVLLEPIKSPEDYIPGNAYFRQSEPIEKNIEAQIYTSQLYAYQTLKKEAHG